MTRNRHDGYLRRVRPSVINVIDSSRLEFVASLELRADLIHLGMFEFAFILITLLLTDVENDQ